jgi:hypothetical protein
MIGNEKKVSVEEMTNPDIFDLVLYDVERTGSIYIIYEDMAKTIPSVVLMPYRTYEELLPNAKMEGKND